MLTEAIIKLIQMSSATFYYVTYQTIASDVSRIEFKRLDIFINLYISSLKPFSSVVRGQILLSLAVNMLPIPFDHYMAKNSSGICTGKH